MDTIVFPVAALINEFSASTTGTDVEYVEVIAAPGTALAYTLVQVEGDAVATGPGIGVIKSVTPITGTTDAQGLALFSLPANTLENGTLTLLLVRGFTGSANQDLDTNNDGTLDVTPWDGIVDTVAVNDGGTGDRTYAAAPVLGTNHDGLSTFAPGGASRIPDARDTDTAADWVRNDFDLAGIPGRTGTPEPGEALNTPGARNARVPEDGGGGTPGGDLVTIMAIQGAGHASPLLGQRVATTGIVTARDNNGFYIQDPTGDGDLRTSDGIFVFTGAGPAVAVGDAVRVGGTVLEFARSTLPGHLTITQLGASPEITVTGSGNALPAATVIGAVGRLAPTEITDNDGFRTYDPAEDGVDFYESLEGMRVQVNDAIAVAPSFNSSGNPGETWVVGDNGANATGLNARGGLTLTETDGNPERIQVQADAGVLPGAAFTANVGDRLGTVTGVLDYDSRGNYELIATAPFTVTRGALEREVTALEKSGRGLLVGTFNVENLDPSDTKFGLLGQQIVTAMNAPDIIALQEIQDNSGTTNDGVTDASLTYQALIAGIAAAGGPTYEFFDIAPVDNSAGGAPGGNIRVGYLYNPDRVDLVEASVAQVLDPALADGNAWANTRIPLRADFLFEGETITLINNHWSSKAGSSPQFGSIQPLVNGSEEQRIPQATVVRDYVAAILDDDPDAAVMVLGDLNEFQWEDALDIVTGRSQGEQILFNLFEDQFSAREQYGYVFDGNHQVLDHILVSAALRAITEFDPVHVNSQWSVTDPGRSSDHDPAVALVSFPAPTAELAFTLWQSSVFGGFERSTWRNELTNLDYTNEAVAGEQMSSRTDDSTGDALARFLAADGDVAIRQADFGRSTVGSAANPAMTLDWRGEDATLALDTAWNSIKTVAITEFTGRTLTVENLVMVAFDLADGDGADPARDIQIRGAKRVDGVTGDGDDVIRVEADSNESRWGNLIRIDTGAGDDAVTIIPSGFDWSASFLANTYNPQWTQTETRLGAGDDVFTGTAAMRNTVIYDGDRDGYVVEHSAALGRTRLVDVDASDGDDGFDVLFNVDVLVFNGVAYDAAWAFA